MTRDAVNFARFAKFSCCQICSSLGAVDKAHKFDLIIYRRQKYAQILPAALKFAFKFVSQILHATIKFAPKSKLKSPPKSFYSY